MLLEMLHAVARAEVDREALRSAGAGRYRLTDAQLRDELVALSEDAHAPIEADEAPEHLDEQGSKTIVLDFGAG